jgi:hypothetical protein
MKKKILSLLVLLVAAVSGAWAQQKYNVTFSGFDNVSCNTTITDVTLPYSKSFGKTDACSNAYDIDGSSNNEQLVGASFGGDNFTITVKSAFEGTITVSVGGNTEWADPYSRNITVACVPAAPPFDYTFSVADCDYGTGTIKFFIDGKEVKGAYQADEGKTVTMTITPDEGWIVDATSVKAESYTTWDAAGARRRSGAPANITILGDVTLTKSTTAENTWTFTMPAASVLVGTGYKKVSNLAFKPADKTNLITVEVDNVVKNRDPQDATKNVNIRRIHNLLKGTSVKLTANTGYKFRKVEVKKGVDYSFDLSTLTSNFEAMDGDILYGTTDKTVTIPNGAHVTLNGVNITSGAAIVCNGNATITLAPGSENTVTSTTDYNSGIRAGGNNTTLTINGTGKLTVKGATKGAGIGSNRRSTCGNIVIEDGEIITTSGDYGAGIGCGYRGTCGTITIKGGTITATGGKCAAGIGSSFDNAICGDILISGGTITAKGGSKAAGIGTGSAQQGLPSTCGKITITDGVTKVTATKGSSAAIHSIGKGQNEQNLAACGTVTIGGVEGYISESTYTYDPHQQ